ncbi:MAG: ParB/RepB/Spo0J family partition protein [bacterium]|nr:ParB/RepB/Spo0J family partition protein [bacterium]
MGKEVININIQSIIPNRFQPRVDFNEATLNELVQSIKKYGIIQPLILRRVPNDNKYEIIAGERRYKAACLSGLTEVPAIITNLDDASSAEIALVENIQRKELNAIEEALSYQKLIDTSHLTPNQLSAKIGKPEEVINSKLKLLSLTKEVQNALTHYQISERHARSLLLLTDANKQIEILNNIIANRLTVKQTDELIKKTIEENKQGGIPMNNNQNFTAVPNNNISQQQAPVNQPVSQPNSNPFMSQFTPQNDTVNINNLNDNTHTNIQDALSSIGLTNTNSDVFNDTETIITDNNNQPSVQQSTNQPTNTQSNIQNQTIQDNSLFKNLKQPPSIENESANMNFGTPQTTFNNQAPINNQSFTQPNMPNQSTNQTVNFQSQQPINQQTPSTPLYSQLFDNNNLFPDLDFTTVEEAQIKKEQEFIPIDNFAKIKESVNTIREFLKQIERNGHKINFEEYDMKKEYQIIIKLPKE